MEPAKEEMRGFKLNLPKGSAGGGGLGSMKGLENESNLTTEQFVNETIMDIS